MRITLFRHGLAGSHDASRWPDDDLRPLTPRGSERTAAAARGLARLAGRPAAVLSSPLTRAMQTAKLLKEALEWDEPIETLEALRPGGSYREVVERLRKFAASDSVFLVGHEPDLGKLAGTLVFGAPSSSLPLKKAGACVVHFDGRPEPGHGRLHLFLPPKVLRRIAGKKNKV